MGVACYMSKITHQERRITMQELQERINELREQQANCSANERAAIQAQIRALQQQMDSSIQQ
jgi:formate-dependent nitrite reductase cytochrome c552 subunit